MMASLETNKIDVQKFHDEIEKYPMLCQSCGMCEAVCPSGAIKISQNPYSQFVPYLDIDKCIGCTKCIKACPVRENMYKSTSVIGPYYKIFLAKSTTKEDVENGSSGGVITALTQYGLDKGIFDEVLTQTSKDFKVISTPQYIKETRKESGSKYISAPLCSVFDRKKCNVVATALPCQAKAIKKQNTDTFIMGLFCSKLSLEDLAKYVAKKNKRKYEDIKKITYRRGNWPGKFKMEFVDTSKNIEENLNRSQFNAAYNSYNFSCSGCLLCDDYFAESADISFGDPWGKKQYVDGYIGETVVIVRTKRGMEFVEKAIEDNAISVSEIDLLDVIRGHLKEIYNKKTALLQRINTFEKESNAMKDYDKKVLIDIKNFKILNKYSIHNNWKRRVNTKKYNRMMKSSMKVMFFVRFSHAFLLSKRLKNSKNLQHYFNVALEEKIEREK
ncbi:MAG: 4Fe-4S dicluster domain-containing protein [Clostridiales bacterium]|nr:4Fe-4S dicluster domain-containing protein [Clostridiales bacterium]